MGCLHGGFVSQAVQPRSAKKSCDLLQSRYPNGSSQDQAPASLNLCRSWCAASEYNNSNGKKNTKITTIVTKHIGRGPSSCVQLVEPSAPTHWQHAF